MSAGSHDNPECPLCMETLEMDDLNFFPCTCGYQICRFCWHRIRTNENGLCPACRKQYSEDPANFKPLTPEELQQIKNDKKQKDLQRKQKISENRKHLANVRVVQKNLVFVVGLPTRLADADELRKPAYFGKFGKIVKVIVNQSTSYAGAQVYKQGPSASAYVTYQKSEDALRAIQAVNNSKVDGRTLKASLGTTKYCSNFLKKLPCPKQDCMYLHELGDEAASFTKEDMQASKHQEYERKLYDQMIANSSQTRKQLSPTEQMDSSFFQKERWPSPPKREDHRPNLTDSPDSPQTSSQSSINITTEPTRNSKSKNKTHSEEHNKRNSPDHLHSHSQEDVENNHEFQENVTENENFLQIRPHNTVNNGSITTEPNLTPLRETPSLVNSSFYQNFDCLQNQPKIQPVENSVSEGQFRGRIPQTNALPEMQIMNSSMHLYRAKSPSLHSPTSVNGLSHGLQYPNLTQDSQQWADTHSREFLKQQRMPETVHGNSSRGTLNTSQDVKLSESLFHPIRYPGAQTVQGSTNHLFNGVCGTSQNGMCSLSQNTLKNVYPVNENTFTNNPEDYLGFDPWKESAKGLADLMVKEADENAKANGFIWGRNATNIHRRTVVPSDAVSMSNHLMENPRYVQRQTVPPPGFSVNNFSANTMPRPSFGEAFPNKMLPVMNMYNQSSSALMSQYQQSMRPQSANPHSNVLHMTDAGMRPQTRDWQESLTNVHQKNLDLSTYNSLASQRLPVNLGRGHSVWNGVTSTDMPWLQEQAVNHGYTETAGRTVSPNSLEKMFQQLKFSDQISRLQNNIKFNAYSSYRGGSS